MARVNGWIATGLFMAGVGIGAAGMHYYTKWMGGTTTNELLEKEVQEIEKIVEKQFDGYAMVNCLDPQFNKDYRNLPPQKQAENSMVYGHLLTFYMELQKKLDKRAEDHFRGVMNPLGETIDGKVE